MNSATVKIPTNRRYWSVRSSLRFPLRRAPFVGRDMQRAYAPPSAKSVSMEFDAPDAAGEVAVTVHWTEET